MTGTGTRRGHGLAIALSFAAQVVMVAAISVISAHLGATSPAPAGAGAHPASPPVPRPTPAPSLYRLSVVIDGKQPGSVSFPSATPTATRHPSFAVRPDSEAVFLVTVSAPAKYAAAGVTINVSGSPWSDVPEEYDFGILDISTLSPGTTVLTADWGAPYLKPGTHELLIMTVRGPDGTVSSPIALITAG
jgi:hypothetical protein